MADKKDPGKFTVRFNVHDPQHQTVVALLNRQGQYPLVRLRPSRMVSTTS